MREEKTNKRKWKKNPTTFREHHRLVTALNQHQHLLRLIHKPRSANCTVWGHTEVRQVKSSPMTKWSWSGRLGDFSSQLFQDLQSKFTWKFKPKWTSEFNRLILSQMHRLQTQYISTSQASLSCNVIKWYTCTTLYPHFLLKLLEMFFIQIQCHKSPFYQEEKKFSFSPWLKTFGI